ncbi:MAG: efflux RND transporter permease subunit [Gammaproteobacteria bacterium]|nr:efflux RND transporter permease subunit [Gammaproteobacteria bacterium]
MGVIDTSTRRPVTVSMFTLALLVFGFVLFNKLGVSLLPDLSYPTLTIRTDYEGAAPVEIENLITKPIEETIGVVKNVKKISSISRAGQSDVLLEFNWGTDMGFAGLEVREKLDILQLPLDISSPVLLRFNPSLDPVMRLSLSMKAEQKSEENKSDSIAFNENSLIELRRFAEEEIKKSLESLEGVAAVKISGGLEDEIQVMVDHEKLAQLNLTIHDISRKLKAENINLSGGRLEEANQQFLVRTINQFQSVDEIANSIIDTINNRPLYLKDIATVSQGWKERESITRISGREAVEIAIYKEGDANTVAVAENVNKRLSKLRKQLSDDMEITGLYDQSRFISQAINEVINSAIVGGLLAMLVLYLFLKDIRATTIISLSIPVSVIITFNMMFAWDISLNIMSLGGIALAVGLLVDNAIVVLENIARKKDQGLDLMTASREGAKEVAGAISAATLTTVAVFVPLVFIEGIAGQLFSAQALTVTFALLISLVVALTIIPMMSSLGAGKKVILGDEPHPVAQKPVEPVKRYNKTRSFYLTGLKVISWPFWFLNKLAEYLLSFIFLLFGAFSWLGHKLMLPFVWSFNKFYHALAVLYDVLLTVALRQRTAVLVTAIVMFVASINLIPQLGVELIPQMSQGEFNIEFRAEPGTPLQKTDDIINSAQSVASTIDAIDRTFSVSGSGNRLDANPEKAGENWGQLSVVLKKPVTQESEEAILRELRSKLGSIPGIQLKFSRPTLFSFKTPLEIEIEGYNLDKLKDVSLLLTKEMEKSKRFADIKSTIEAGYPEVQIKFDHERAARLGLSVPDIAETIVKQIRGNVATKYSFRDRKIDVLVRVEEEDRTSVNKIRSLIINPESERPVNLSAIADVKMAIGPSEINRVAQERVAIISANLNYGALGDAASEAQGIIDRFPNFDGIEIRVAGQNEEMQHSFQSMQYALALAVFLVYLVMASIFESLLHPFVILFSIPLAIVGAVLALYFTNTTISVVVFIGLIMLAGIVVNNAIVLIDLINQLRAEGMERMQAIQEAGLTRLRPIIMTTLTTTFGMLPLAMGLDEGAEIRAPMAITVIGGLLMSTMLTLIVVPVLYSLMDRKHYNQQG